MRLKRESLFAPVSVPCFDFKDSEDHELSKKTVIIAPVRKTECQDGSIQVSWHVTRRLGWSSQKASTSSLKSQTKALYSLINRVV